MLPSDFPAGGYTSDYVGFWVIWLVLAAGAFLFVRASRGKSGRVRLVAGNALVFGAILWTVVLAAETYLRYVYDRTDSYGLTLTNWSWFGRHVDFNGGGFRDVEWSAEKRPGTERIACIGDSFTMGWGVPDVHDAFPQRIASALQARAPGRFEVRNYGVAGYTTGHELSLIEQAVPGAQFDRVILGYCLNDPDDLLPPDRWFDRDKAPRVPLLKPTTSFVADFLWFRLVLADDPHIRDYYAYGREAYEDPQIWARQCERFRLIAMRCRAASVRLVVVVFPFLHDWGPSYRFDGCHDRVVEAWQKLGVQVIDLREAYRGIPGSELVANRLDAHPNARAHEIAARTILDRVFDVR